jgi:hypothetical protein
MNINEIRVIAKQGKATKCDLVRAIQQDEGNQPCFGTNSSGQCGQASCLWRED